MFTKLSVIIIYIFNIFSDVVANIFTSKVLIND
jgi:hypothetical protein